MLKLEVWVPGPLTNPMNGSHGHWSTHYRWAKDWRERTHQHLFAAIGAFRLYNPREAKRVIFTAHTARRWDTDNLAAGMKPCRDALKDAGLIHDDGPDSGHRFEYAQRIDRQHRGVLITVTLRMSLLELHSVVVPHN